ncbi:MAG: hypothetical protein EOM83_02005 [Clostridia bacterium]|nr:hypothetical protein [Clostridia bacterium]
MKKINLFIVALLIVTTSLSAQTGGPGQPEFMQFEQAGTSDMVSPSTGSFSYQIPLFTIGGYPMNLTYQAGIRMEDVSTMVGLGWNLNAGTIVRSLRGLPDDFSGDIITKEFSVKDNKTYGGKIDVDLEIAGIDSKKLAASASVGVSAGLGLFYNNYKGWGAEVSMDVSLSANKGGGSASLGLGIAANSQSGVNKYISPNIGFAIGSDSDKIGISLGKTWSVNSSEGLSSSLNTGLSYTRYSDKKTSKTMRNGEKKDAPGSGSASLMGFSKQSYLNNSFQPDIDYPFINTAGTYSGSIGFDAYMVDPGIRFTGYYSKQTLATKIQKFPAYGIMHETEGMPANALMDFNREKKLPYYVGESKILPVPYKTPDVFNLNAQGISLTFSVGKNDIGIVGDPTAELSSVGNKIGAEVHLGGVFKAGANIGVNSTTQKSGRWIPSELSGKLTFKPDQDAYSLNLYQQHYFKNHGETNRFDHSLFKYLNSYKQFSFSPKDELSLNGVFAHGNSIKTEYINKFQPVRQTAINYLTAGEADKIGFDKKILYYKFSNNSQSELAENRTSSVRKAHHLSEISVSQPDGMRYVFGIPVYNTTEKEVTFNVSKNTVDPIKNLVKYDKSDNSTGNTKGTDNYFESMTTPAYVTQFLITAVLSPDYRDLTADGISDDDVGNYVKFSYFKEDFLYRWRTPFEQDQATYSRGLRSDDMDDKGTYVYGEKELWYIRSIESKTEIARFFYCERKDGFGVLDENGGIDQKMFLRQLDSIVVYSMHDYTTNYLNATPIKTIHFTFDQTLCKGINNTSTAGGGKLSLKEVAITYENSQKGLLTPYAFDYGKMPDGNVINPDYSTRDVNRWGYYQENPTNALSDCDDSKPLSNIDFPYASQDRDMMNKNAYAWNLTHVTIPGGGKIIVEYEALDYAYLQDKQAGQMFLVKGLGNLGQSDLNSNNLKIFFDIPTTIKSKDQLFRHCLLDITSGQPNLYYKFYVNLNGNEYDYITGYAGVVDWGVDKKNNINYGWIKLANVALDDDMPKLKIKTNTIHKTAIQFLRINRNSLVFSSGQPNPSGSFEGFINGLPDAFIALSGQLEASASGGLNNYCMIKGFCSKIDINKSFIRLFNPTKDKIAGGSRVAKISINDRFGEMTGGVHQSKAYTTSYYYTTEEISSFTGDTITISSGVADYEPMIGGDEISLKRPIFYSDKKKKAPDNEFYVEEPVNESNFPSPQIIYSKVAQVTNEDGQHVGKTGKVVNEFFTAKDYPVKVDRTIVYEQRDKSSGMAFTIPFSSNNQQHDFATVAQGYSIELNSVSGNQKATWVYNENGDRISGETFEYADENDNFTTIDRYGEIHKNTTLGLTVEYTIDCKKSTDEMKNQTFSANINTILVIGPIPIPIPLYTQMSEKKQFQSIVCNKIIHRNALVKRHTVYSQTAAVSTENLAYDEVTGEVLLTVTTNEFNDSLYSFTYPAWWMYPGMGPAYENTRMYINRGNYNTFKQFLKPGDELRTPSNGNRIWVSYNTGNFLTTKNHLLAKLPNATYLVYSSGHKNLLNDKAGQVVTWNYNPLSKGKYIDFSQSAILNSNVIEYDNVAVNYCSYCPTEGDPDQPDEPPLPDEDDPIIDTTYQTPIQPDGIFYQNVNPDTSPEPTISPDLIVIDTSIPIQSGTQGWNNSSSTPALPDPPQNPIGLSGSVNPFLTGSKGTWKAKTSRFFLTERTHGNLNTGTGDIRTQGLFKTYNDFWVVPKSPTMWGKDYNNWEWNETINMVDVDGQIIETEDRIGRKTSSLLGYKNTVILAQASNAGYHEIFYDGFEDYQNSPCPSVWFSDLSKRVISTGNGIIDATESHTGKYALQVSNSVVLRPKAPVATNDTACIGGWYPYHTQSDITYLFSCWVKVDKPKPVLNCSDASVVISSAGQTLTLLADGPVIEGWQRVMGTFVVASRNLNITISLEKGTANTYFDDVRIIPFDANMTAYVYDDMNLRLTYILDENNYFTRYEYNNQGELIRIKKETEEGILTIQEAYQALVKKRN